jgi:hypothetical protein
MSSDPRPLIPPRYANVPSLPTYDPDLPDPLFRTYVRLTGLAWVNDYRETPPLTLAELCAVCHCSERTLWGHLTDLRQRGLLSWEMGSGGQMTLSPAQPPVEREDGGAGTDGNPSGSSRSGQSLAALAEFGVKVDVAFARQVAALPHVTPERVRAWGEHYRGQPGIRNLPGVLLHTLQATTRLPRPGRDPRGGPRHRDDASPSPQAVQAPLPELVLDDELSQMLERLGLAGDDAWTEVARVAADDAEFVRAWAKYVEARAKQFTRPAGFLRSALRGNTWPPAEADPEQERLERWRTWARENEDGPPVPRRSLREETMERYGIAPETMDLWQAAQQELSLQMTRATYDTWIRGALLLSIEGNKATIGVRSPAAKDWLENRLAPVFQRTLGRHFDGPVELVFVVLESPARDEAS